MIHIGSPRCLSDKISCYSDQDNVLKTCVAITYCCVRKDHNMYEYVIYQKYFSRLTVHRARILGGIIHLSPALSLRCRGTKSFPRKASKTGQLSCTHDSDHLPRRAPLLEINAKMPVVRQSPAMRPNTLRSTAHTGRQAQRGRHHTVPTIGRLSSSPDLVLRW